MSVKRVTLMLFGDDSQLKHVLDEVERRKKEIAGDIKIKVEGDSAATIAQLEEIKHLLDQIQRKRDELKLGGLLGRLGGLGGNNNGGLGNGQGGILGFLGRANKAVNRLIERIPGIGGALSALGNPVALAIITAAVTTLSAVIGSLIGNIAAAGLGLGSLAALALPSLKAIQKGVRDVSKETTALGRNKALQAVPAAFRPAVKDIIQMKAVWMDMSKSIEPLIGRIIALGTSIGKTLLPMLKPFAERAGTALEGLLKQFERVTQSQGFKSFMSTMLKFSGPAITAIGQGLGQVLGALGDELKQLTNGKSLIVLKTTFAVIAGSIRLVGQALRTAINWTFHLGDAFLAIAHGAIVAAKDIGDAFLGAISAILHAGSHLPIVGKKFADDAKQVDSWKTSFDNSMNGAITKVDEWKHALDTAPKIMTLQANIQNLVSRLATAKDKLRDPDLTKTRRARIEANIDNLKANLARAKAELMALQGYTVQTYIATYRIDAGANSGNSGGHPLGAPGQTTNAAVGSGTWDTGDTGARVMGSDVMGSDVMGSGTWDGGGGHGHHPRHHRKPPFGRKMVRVLDPIMTPGGPFIGEHFRHRFIRLPIGPPRHWRDGHGGMGGGPSHHHHHHRGHGGGTSVVINFNGVVTNPNATAKEIQTMLLNFKRSRGGGDLGLA